MFVADNTIIFSLKFEVYRVPLPWSNCYEIWQQTSTIAALCSIVLKARPWPRGASTPNFMALSLVSGPTAIGLGLEGRSLDLEILALTTSLWCRKYRNRDMHHVKQLRLIGYSDFSQTVGKVFSSTVYHNGDVHSNILTDNSSLKARTVILSDFTHTSECDITLPNLQYHPQHLHCWYSVDWRLNELRPHHRHLHVGLAVDECRCTKSHQNSCKSAHNVVAKQYFAASAIALHLSISDQIPVLPTYIRSSARMRETLSSGALASNVSGGQSVVIDQSKADRVTTHQWSSLFYTRASLCCARLSDKT